jgi:AraC-like DNA-binding protein
MIANSERHEAVPATRPRELSFAREVGVTQRIVDYIDRNYAMPISLRDIADTFGYSPCHLTNSFSRTTGTPITAWIIRRRIEAAKQLLSAGSVDVATAAEAAGFNDLCYFTRQFVRHVGTTPGRFRATAGKTAGVGVAGREPAA